MKVRSILAIEAAVGEGSISLLRNGDEGSIEVSRGGASRAEKIITEIDELLRQASLSKHDLDLIAISVGPGSYSGIRIGISTALGLGDSLDIPVVGISVLEALASSVAAEKVIAVVPIGRSDVAWQIFKKGSDGKTRPMTEPRLASIMSFPESLDDHRDFAIVAPSHNFEPLRDVAGGNRTLIEIDSSLAVLIGRLAAEDGRSLAEPKPIYMRSAVAR